MKGNNVLIKHKNSLLFNMPSVFYIILVLDLCERFAYYGLYSVLIFYLIHQFHLSEEYSSLLFALFTSLSYGLMMFGGLTGDKILGIKRSYILGILVLFIGHTLLFLQITKLSHITYALAVILVGVIFFKTNTSSYLGKCFPASEYYKLDSAYTYLYMTTNIGSLISTIIIPLIVKFYSYQIAFTLNAMVMLFALFIYLILYKKIPHVDKIKSSTSTSVILFLAVFIIALLLQRLLSSSKLVYFVFILLLVVSVIIYFLIMLKNKKDRVNMSIALALLFQSFLFWYTYMQSNTGFLLFTAHNVNMIVFGHKLPTPFILTYNQLFIILLSPVFAKIYHSNDSLSNSKQHILGFLSVLIGFSIIVMAIKFFSHNNQISLFWMVLAILFTSAGEMLIAAVGPSMITKLLPDEYSGFGQGIWYLPCGAGMLLGGKIVSLFSGMYPENNNVVSLAIYKMQFTYDCIAIIMFLMLSLTTELVIKRIL